MTVAAPQRQHRANFYETRACEGLVEKVRHMDLYSDGPGLDRRGICGSASGRRRGGGAQHTVIHLSQ